MGTAAGKKIGEALDIADKIQRRDVKEWRDRVGELVNYCQSLTQELQEEGKKARAKHFREIAQTLYNDLDESTRGWTKTREEIEARKSYMDLQAKVIEAWPKPATAERLFYVGAAFLGAGGVAYAYLGAAEVVAYLFLWSVGVGCLIGSVIRLLKYDRERDRYFNEIRNRLS